jgi:hypothetical protein
MNLYEIHIKPRAPPTAPATTSRLRLPQSRDPEKHWENDGKCARFCSNNEVV